MVAIIGVLTMSHFLCHLGRSHFAAQNESGRICQRRTVKNLKRRPENDPNAGNKASVIYAGTLSAGQLSTGSSAGGTGWTPVIHPVDVLLVVNEPGDEGLHGIRVGVGRQGGGAVAAAIRLGVMMVFGYARIS